MRTKVSLSAAGKFAFAAACSCLLVSLLLPFLPVRGPGADHAIAVSAYAGLSYVASLFFAAIQLVLTACGWKQLGRIQRVLGICMLPALFALPVLAYAHYRWKLTTATHRELIYEVRRTDGSPISEELRVEIWTPVRTSISGLTTSETLIFDLGSRIQNRASIYDAEEARLVIRPWDGIAQAFGVFISDSPPETDWTGWKAADSIKRTSTTENGTTEVLQPLEVRYRLKEVPNHFQSS